MNRYTRSEIVSGLFVALAVAIFTLYAFQIVRFDPFSFLKPDRLQCVADLSNAAGLASGAAVSVAGRDVGRVIDVTVSPRQLSSPQVQHLIDLFGEDAFPDLQVGMTRQVAQVRFELTHPQLRLDPDTAKVSLQRDGLLGSMFLALDPGYWSGDPPRAIDLAADEPLRIRGEESPGMAEIFARLAPVMAQTKSLLTNADGILAENRPHVRNMIAQMEGMLEENRPGLKNLVDNADALVAENRPRIAALLEELQSTAGTLEDKVKLVSDDAERLLELTHEVMTENRPRIAALLDDLRSTTGTLEEKIKLVSEDAERLLELTHDVMAENRPEIAETMRRLRRTMWEAEMAMRKIRANPAYLIFGDEEQLLNQNPYDSSWIRRSGRAEPFEQRDENMGEGDGR